MLLPHLNVSPRLLPPGLPEAELYANTLIEAATHVRFGELLRQRPAGALYYLSNRQGVSAVALRTSDLSEEQITNILLFRLAQYLAVRHVHPEHVYAHKLRHEPTRYMGSDDVHILVGSAATGILLSYVALRLVPGAVNLPVDATLRTVNRQYFPVEEYHGWGVFNELPVLPDVALGHVREAARFIKNQRLHVSDELGARGPIEVGAALTRLLLDGSLCPLEVLIGDLEEQTSLHNFLYFHTPLMLLERTATTVPATSYAAPRYHYHAIHPYAILVADCGEEQRERLEQVEQALALSGRQGLQALLALRRSAAAARSQLQPNLAATSAALLATQPMGA